MRYFYLITLLLFICSCNSSSRNSSHIVVFESFIENLTKDKIDNEQLTLISQLILNKRKDIRAYSPDSIKYCKAKNGTYPISLFINEINRHNKIKNGDYNKNFKLKVIRDSIYVRESLYRTDSIAMIWFTNARNDKSETWVVKMTKPNNKWLVDIPILNYYKSKQTTTN